MKFIQIIKLRIRLFQNKKPVCIVFDVDGVLTDGTFFYTIDGKVMKNFGAHDADALKILGTDVKIKFISADLKGFNISEKRIIDMGYRLAYMDRFQRIKLIESLKSDYFVIFVADSFTDIEAMKMSNFSVVPRNGHFLAKESADLVLMNNGGHGAVSEICLILSEIKYANR